MQQQLILKPLKLSRTSFNNMKLPSHNLTTVSIGLLRPHLIVVEQEAHDFPAELVQDALHSFAHQPERALHPRQHGEVLLEGEVLRLAAAREHGDVPH